MNKKITLEIDYNKVIIKVGKKFGLNNSHIILPKRLINKKVILIETD